MTNHILITRSYDETTTITINVLTSDDDSRAMFTATALYKCLEINGGIHVQLNVKTDKKNNTRYLYVIIGD